MSFCWWIVLLLPVLCETLSTYRRNTGFPPPENVQVRITSETSIAVTWDKPAYPVAGYKVYYSMFSSPDMRMWPSIKVGPVTEAEITDLEPYTIYDVRVQSELPDGQLSELSVIASPAGWQRS